MNDKQQKAKAALILSGGGARAAYQVGVLKAIAEMMPTRPKTQSPFQIICGTSSGAINAAKLASEANQFKYSVAELEKLWSGLSSAQIHRVGFRELIESSFKLFISFFRSGIAHGRPLSLFDNQPLFDLLTKQIDMTRLPHMIKQGHLSALNISALGYQSGENVNFFQANPEITGWRSGRRVGMPCQLTHQHLMASSALPAIFPAVKINREYFGDGAIRQTAPMSAALHLGAEKLFVVGVSSHFENDKHETNRVATLHPPSIAQILGQLLNSAFIDAQEDDVAMLKRFNGFANAVDDATQAQLKIRPVDILVIEPSIPFDQLATDLAHSLPRAMRVLLKTLGANTKAGGASFVSYLLFEAQYCQALIKAGYQDAQARQSEISTFLELS